MIIGKQVIKISFSPAFLGLDSVEWTIDFQDIFNPVLELVDFYDRTMDIINNAI